MVIVMMNSPRAINMKLSFRLFTYNETTFLVRSTMMSYQFCSLSNRLSEFSILSSFSTETISPSMLQLHLIRRFTISIAMKSLLPREFAATNRRLFAASELIEYVISILFEVGKCIWNGKEKNHNLSSLFCPHI